MTLSVLRTPIEFAVYCDTVHVQKQRCRPHLEDRLGRKQQSELPQLQPSSKGQGSHKVGGEYANRVSEAHHQRC